MRAEAGVHQGHVQDQTLLRRLWRLARSLGRLPGRGGRQSWSQVLEEEVLGDLVLFQCLQVFCAAIWRVR